MPSHAVTWFRMRRLAGVAWESSVLFAVLFDSPMAGCGHGTSFTRAVAVLEGQKSEFFRTLPDLVEKLPLQCCQFKILPVLTEGLQYGAVDSVVLAPLLKVHQKPPTARIRLGLFGRISGSSILQRLGHVKVCKARAAASASCSCV